MAVETLEANAAETGLGAGKAVTLIDCDVHPACSIEELVDHVPEPWRSTYFKRFATEAASPIPGVSLPPVPPRLDLADGNALAPRVASDVVERELLQRRNVDFAILIVLAPRPPIVNPGLASALARAHNEWLAATWLGRDNWHGRYRGSIQVCPDDPAGAVEEIERWAGHPYVAQVSLFPESTAPFGRPQYRPIFEASARHGLPVALHIVKQPGMRSLTPVGFPSYWLEIFAAHPLLYMNHLASMVFGGTFEAIPDLRVVCVEGGFSWFAPFAWRLDNQWRALGAEVPEVKRAPSEYFAEGVRLTTQPLDEVKFQKQMHHLMEWMNAGELLMLATDFPHYDEDTPDWTLPRLPRHMRDAIAYGNARALYGLPASRPVDDLDRGAA